MNDRQQTNPCRHKCLSEHHGPKAPPAGPLVRNIADLRHLLQEAIELEHFTIPPYLCALYSIQDGANPQAARIVHSVVMEEMLHMVMAANLLNAIGGKPEIGARKILLHPERRKKSASRNPLPHYPDRMPHSSIGFEVHLLKFSPAAINTFLAIERPAETDLPPPLHRDEFRSIGEFYTAVREGMIRLDAEAKARGQKNGIFTGTQAQVTAENYYGSGGKLIAVYSLKEANLVLDEIVGQGEGIKGTILDGDPQPFGKGIEYAHYFRFNEVFNERFYASTDKATDAPSGPLLPVDWDAVYNMMPDPRMAACKGNPGVLGQMKDFNKLYMQVLDKIDEACSGNPQVMWKEAVPLMYGLKYQAIALMKTPCGPGDFTAGPSFEYVP
jgi:hypothetical protein